MFSSLRPKNISIPRSSLVGTFVLWVVVSSWRATLATLSGTYFWRMPLHPKNSPSSASSTPCLGGAFRRSLSPFTTQIVQFLNIITSSSNSGKWGRCGTATWQKILTHRGLVLWINPFRSGLNPERDNPTPLRTSTTPFFVISPRLYTMLRSLRGGVVCGGWFGRIIMRRGWRKGWCFGWQRPFGERGRWLLWTVASVFCRGSYVWIKRDFCGRSWLRNGATGQRVFR